MAGFGEITVPVTVEVEVAPPEGVIPARFAAWTTARSLLGGAFRGFLPGDVLTLAAFLAGVDREEEAEDTEEVDISDFDPVELADDDVPDEM